MENAEADAANEVLRNKTIAKPLKYVHNSWISLEMPLTNCKVELKFNRQTIAF